MSFEKVINMRLCQLRARREGLVRNEGIWGFLWVGLSRKSRTQALSEPFYAYPGALEDEDRQGPYPS